MADDRSEITGLDLRLLRVRAGLTQAQLGERLGVGPRRISELEASTALTLPMARRIAQALLRDREKVAR